MQSKKSQKVFTIFGLLLIAIAGGGFVWYEWAGGREMINYQDVIVLSQDVKQGEVINEDLISYLKVDKLSTIDGVIHDPATVIGKEAKHFIPSNTQLHSNYFEEAGIVLKEGQYIAQIPIEWTLSIPDTLRRGDQIAIYAATYDKQVLASLQPKETSTVTSNEEKEANEDSSKIEVTNGKGEVVENITTEETQVNETTISNTQPELTELLSTKVAYVRDGSNKEVVTISLKDRIDASSNIQNVEIITTAREFQEIENKIKQGGKLIIMYSDKDTEKVATTKE